MAKRKGDDAEPKRPDKSAIDDVAAGNANRPGKLGKGSEGEPNEVHLAWYREWTVFHQSIADIARNAGVGRSTAHEAIHKVKEWMKLRLFDNVVDFRHRQTLTLEMIAKEAIQAWLKSKEKSVTLTTETGNSPGEHGGPWDKESVREQDQFGGAQYLSEARAAMAEIRDIWGVNMPKKLAIELSEYDGMIDPSGMDYNQAVVEQAKAIVAAHEAE
jgi:hypothetical protein